MMPQTTTAGRPIANIEIALLLGYIMYIMYIMSIITLKKKCLTQSCALGTPAFAQTTPVCMPYGICIGIPALQADRHHHIQPCRSRTLVDYHLRPNSPSPKQ